MTLAELTQKYPDGMLLTDSQEIIEVLLKCDIRDKDRGGIYGAFVESADGAYMAVYLSESSQPWSNNAIYHTIEYYGGQI